jgi:DNA-binding response OmpR family regulator
MVDGICRLLQAALEQASADEAAPANRWQFQRNLIPTLRGDEYLTRECRKIWDECTPAEQSELAALNLADHVADPTVIDTLLRRHVLQRIEGRPQLFCRLLAEFVQGRALPQATETTSLWVDTASGNVLVNGVAVETLTALEYKLVMLLFQNRDKLVDKYQIVTSVWGESYLNEVDDARIEKLISRLRQKIEPDPANPRFLTTVRGRGYRLSVT